MACASNSDAFLPKGVSFSCPCESVTSLSVFPLMGAFINTDLALFRYR